MKNCPENKCPGNKCPENNCPENNCPENSCAEKNSSENNCPENNCPENNCPENNCILRTIFLRTSIRRSIVFREEFHGEEMSTLHFSQNWLYFLPPIYFSNSVIQKLSILLYDLSKKNMIFFLRTLIKDPFWASSRITKLFDCWLMVNHIFS